MTCRCGNPVCGGCPPLPARPLLPPAMPVRTLPVDEIARAVAALLAPAAPRPLLPPAMPVRVFRPDVLWPDLQATVATAAAAAASTAAADAVGAEAGLRADGDTALAARIDEIAVTADPGLAARIGALVVSALLDAGGPAPPFYIAAADTGHLVAWVSADGRLMTGRNGGDEVATLQDVAPAAAVAGAISVVAGSVEEAPAPPFYLVNTATGHLVAWVTADGRLMTGRNGGDEVATVADVAPAASLLQSVRVVTGTDEDGAPLPPWHVLDVNTGYLVAWIDAEGAFHAGGASGASGTSAGALLVDWAGGTLRVLQPSPRAGSAVLLEHSFERYASGVQAGLWQYRSTYTCAGSGYTAARDKPLVAFGQNDIVSSEASDGAGLSIDYPAETSLGWIGGTAHGHEYQAPLGPRSSVAQALVLIDGREADLSAAARWSGHEVKIISRTELYRPRSPALVPGVATPYADVIKEWTVTEDGLSVEYWISYREQFTGTVYFPLLCTQEIFSRAYVDAAMLVGGVAKENLWLTVPDDIGSLVDAYSASPARRVLYTSATGEAVTVEVGEPLMWAAGQRPWGTRLAPGRDQLWIRTDGGYHKLYWPTGSAAGTYGGVASYRAAAGEQWERKIFLTFEA